jgi:hypothetical protein
MSVWLRERKGGKHHVEEDYAKWRTPTHEHSIDRSARKLEV